MEINEIPSLTYSLNALIGAHDSRIHVYHSLVTRVNCMLVKPFLMRGITSSTLCKTQLINELVNYGGSFTEGPSFKYLTDFKLNMDEYEPNIRQKVDRLVLAMYEDMLRKDLPDHVHQLIRSQYKFLNNFVSHLKTIEPVSNGKLLALA